MLRGGRLKKRGETRTTGAQSSGVEREAGGALQMERVKGKAHREKVSGERWSPLLRRDADHRVRGCCGIKGFVSQSPLTLSLQSRLQVLREAWTWNNS